MSTFNGETRFPTARQIVVTAAANQAAGIRTTSPALSSIPTPVLCAKS